MPLELAVGMQIFHKGTPMELLYRIYAVDYGELWQVKPLFVEKDSHSEFFEPHDRITFVHTNSVRATS